MTGNYVLVYNFIQFQEIEKRFGRMRYRRPVERELAGFFQEELKKSGGFIPLDAGEGGEAALSDIASGRFAVYQMFGASYFIPGLRNLSQKESGYSQIVERMENGGVALLRLYLDAFFAVDRYTGEKMPAKYVECYNMESFKQMGIALDPNPVMEFSDDRIEQGDDDCRKAVADAQNDAAGNDLKLYSMYIGELPGLQERYESMPSELNQKFFSFIYRGGERLRRVSPSPSCFYDKKHPDIKLSYGYLVAYNRVMFDAIREHIESRLGPVQW